MEKSSQQIELQIAALERKVSGMTAKNTGFYALENKIKNLKKSLVEVKKFEFLAR